MNKKFMFASFVALAAVMACGSETPVVQPNCIFPLGGYAVESTEVTGNCGPQDQLVVDLDDSGECGRNTQYSCPVSIYHLTDSCTETKLVGSRLTGYRNVTVKNTKYEYQLTFDADLLEGRGTLVKTVTPNNDGGTTESACQSTYNVHFVHGNKA